MATRLGIIGLPNTGKSKSREFIKRGEDCFVITPSDKFHYLRHSKGEKILPLDLSTSNLKGMSAVKQALKAPNTKDVVRVFAAGQGPPSFEVSGNFAIMDDINYVLDYLRFIDKYMPNIRVVFLADFTHFISTIVGSQQFMDRKHGGEAFQRFWDMAAAALNNIFKSIEKLERRDLIVVTEFHAQMNQDSAKDDGFYDVFLPAGKMLNNAFLPKSYFDFMLCTHVEPYSDETTEADRYKFVVVKKKPYDARMGGYFPEAVKGMIPNNMGTVINRIREKTM